MWLREVGPHILRGLGLMFFMFVGLWILGMGANWLFGGKAAEKNVVPLSRKPGSYPVSHVRIVIKPPEE